MWGLDTIDHSVCRGIHHFISHKLGMFYSCGCPTPQIPFPSSDNFAWLRKMVVGEVRFQQVVSYLVDFFQSWLKQRHRDATVPCSCTRLTKTVRTCACVSRPSGDRLETS